jgi:hypothetical protein
MLARRLQQVRERSYALADTDPDGRLVGARLAARADAYALLTAATTAAVVAGGGHALAPGAPPSGWRAPGCSSWSWPRPTPYAGRPCARWQAAL